MQHSARFRLGWKNGLITAGILVLATALGLLFDWLDLQEVNLYALFLLGILLTFWASRLLSATVLKGVPSSFTLELPPFRRPRAARSRRWRASCSLNSSARSRAFRWRFCARSTPWISSSPWASRC